MALLDVKNLTKRFGGLVANKDISLSVDAGEIVGVVGEAGVRSRRKRTGNSRET